MMLWPVCWTAGGSGATRSGRWWLTLSPGLEHRLADRAEAAQFRADEDAERQAAMAMEERIAVFMGGYPLG